jgi:hypothetical protein
MGSTIFFESPKHSSECGYATEDAGTCSESPAFSIHSNQSLFGTASNRSSFRSTAPSQAFFPSDEKAYSSFRTSLKISRGISEASIESIESKESKDSHQSRICECKDKLRSTSGNQASTERDDFTKDDFPGFGEKNLYINIYNFSLICNFTKYYR